LRRKKKVGIEGTRGGEGRGKRTEKSKRTFGGGGGQVDVARKRGAKKPGRSQYRTNSLIERGGGE